MIFYTLPWSRWNNQLINTCVVPLAIAQFGQKCLVLKSGTVDIGLSDHMLIYTILNKKLMKPKARFIKERSFKEFNEIEFNKDLQIVPFHVAYVFNEIDNIYWAWERLYNNVLDDHAPIKCKKVKESFGGSKFITFEIRKAIRLRNAFKRKYNKSRTPENWEVYRFVLNRIVTIRRKSVIHHFNQLRINSAGRPKEFWNSLRPLMHSKRRPPNGYITLKQNNTIIKDQNLVADTLNSYFRNVVDSLDIQP